MKNFLFVFALFLSSFVSAQNDTIPVTLVRDGINISGILIIPKQVVQSPVTSINGRVGDIQLTPADVQLPLVNNTADINKPISNPVQNAFNNLPNLFASKIHRHNVSDIDGLSSGGTGGEGPTVLINAMQFWKEVRTPSFGQTIDGSTIGAYRYGSFSSHPNNSDGVFQRPDEPFIIWSYNSLGNNAREFSNEYNLDMTVESNWWNPTIGDRTIEWHLMRGKDKRNIEHRWISLYAGQGNGNSFLNMESSSLNLYSRAKEDYLDVEAQPFFRTFAGQIELWDVDNNNAGIKLKNRSGLTTVLNQFGDVPVFDLPKTNAGDGKSYFHYDGYGHLKMVPKSIYGSDQEAINNGLSAPDVYWTMLNGRPYLTMITAQPITLKRKISVKKAPVKKTVTKKKK